MAKRRPKSRRHPKPNQPAAQQAVAKSEPPLPGQIEGACIQKAVLERDVYLREREFLIDGARSSGEEHSKQVLTIASGAFGISLIFIEKLTPNGCSSFAWYMLIASWLFLSLAMTSMIIAYLLTQKAVEEQIEILDSQHMCGEEAKSGRWGSRVSFLNIFGSLCLCVGVFAMGTVAVLNLPRSSDTITNVQWHDQGLELKMTEPKRGDLRGERVEGSYRPVRGPVNPEVKERPYIAPTQPTVPPKSNDSSK